MKLPRPIPLTRQERLHAVTFEWDYGDDRKICLLCRRRIPYEMTCLSVTVRLPIECLGGDVCERCLETKLKSLKLTRGRYTYR